MGADSGARTRPGGGGAPPAPRLGDSGLDFLCFHLMLVAIMLPVWKPYEHRAKAVLWSITCILAWMRLIRALQLTKYAGLVLIMIKMADDVFKLFVMMYAAQVHLNAHMDSHTRNCL